jgi:hypothetical protein
MEIMADGEVIGRELLDDEGGLLIINSLDSLQEHGASCFPVNPSDDSPCRPAHP